MEHDGQAVPHSQRGIPEMLRTMAEPLGEVCSVTRRLLRRGLGLQTSRRVNVFFPAKGPILLNSPRTLLVCWELHLTSESELGNLTTKIMTDYGSFGNCKR